MKPQGLFGGSCMGALLRAEHVSISYNGKEVVKDVSFDVNEGEILAIVGESGSGKSTIIKAVMGLLGRNGMVTRGDIFYKDMNIVDMPEKEKRRLFGPEIAMVFQDCKAALCPVRKISSQIYEQMREHMNISKKEALFAVSEIMKKVGLTDCDRILDSYPFELSGGMNQRVGICMAMAMKPKLLLADEPTSALDVTVQKQVVDEMLMLRWEYNTSVVIVTHNMGVARRMADKILVLKDGKTEEYGNSGYVLEHSKNRYTKELMGSVLHLNKE